jgi:hypothetical protein
MCYSLSERSESKGHPELAEGNTFYDMPSTPVEESSAFSTGQASSGNKIIVFGRSGFSAREIKLSVMGVKTKGLVGSLFGIALS